MTDAVKHPRYMLIFWWLAALTVIELAVVFAPVAKLVIVVLLCALAVAKAALVAMYFMHLRFETRTLGLIAVTPVTIAVLLLAFVLPDGSAVAHKTEAAKRATSTSTR